MQKMSSWCQILPKKNNLGIMEASATNYQFRKEFEGVGLNRQKQITRK